LNKINNSKNNHFIPDVIRALKPYKKRLMLGLSAAGLAAAFDAAGPMLLKHGIDGLREARPISWLFIFAGLILLAAGIAGFFRFFMRFHVISVCRYAESDLRDNFFQHLLKLSPTYFDRIRTGDLMARATEDIDRLRMVMGPMLLFSVNTSLMILFSAVMMFILDYVLAACVLLLVPLVGISVFIVASRLHSANIKQQEALSDMTSQVQENLTGIRVIKAFVREDHESQQFKKVCRVYFKRSMKVARVQALFMPLLAMLIGFGIAGILWIGGLRISTGIMTLGEFIAFMSYLSLMTWPMVALGWMTHLYQQGKVSHKRLQKVFSVEPQFGSAGVNANNVGKDVQVAGRNAYATRKITTAPEIQFQNITLRYNEDEPQVLSNINLTIPPGATVAIVGQVGCGKSSFVRLLPRLYSPQTGEILLNGIQWSNFNIFELRKTIGYVDQTPFLFSTTIRENIAIGLAEASEEEIISAAKAACFDDEIDNFPEGYDTKIGERGITLSGGQQQRLTLARALLIDPPLLILDDALSAVDSDTEAEILNNLQDRLEGRTMLFVTHRLNIAELADRILVIDRGRLVEDGSHDELMSKDGLYAVMFHRQKLVDELGALS